MKFILTIDTEADNQWTHGIPISTRNIRNIPRLQELCDRYHVLPTYLVTSEVCEDAFAREILREYVRKGDAEVGAHLHSWTTPPFEDTEGLRFNDRYHPFATELSDSLLGSKILNLTRQIENSFGLRPTSFRSGRYGFDGRVARVLIKHGYLVDSSVTPLVDWSDTSGMPGGAGGMNFSDARIEPHAINSDGKTLWEIPITILPTRFPLTTSDRLTRLYLRFDRSIPSAMMRKLYLGNQPLWFRPYKHTTLPDFVRLLRIADRKRLGFIVMMFHSSELMAGGSPYWKDESDLDKLYDLLKRLLEELKKREITSVTLTQAGQELRSQKTLC